MIRYLSSVERRNNTTLLAPRELNTPFVNRDDALQRAWSALAANWEMAPDLSVKPVLLVTGQMFGTGKTAFGQTLLNMADAHVRQLFERSEAARSPAAAALRSAETVTIDLQMHPPETFHDAAQDFDLLLSRRVWRCVLERCGVPCSVADPQWLDWKPSLQSCVGALSEHLLAGSALFLHIDEVGAINEWPLFFPALPGDTREQAALRAHHALWAALQPLLRDRRAFVYLTGRVVLIGTGLCTASPSRVMRLSLACLEPRHVALMVERGTFRGAPLSAAIAPQGVTGAAAAERVAEEVRRVHGLTAGVARLAMYALEHLASFPGSGDADLAAAVREAPGGRVPLAAAHRPALEPALIAAACGLELGEDARLPPASSGLSAVQWAMAHSTTVANSDRIRFVLPGVWLDQICALPDWAFLRALAARFAEPGASMERVACAALLMHCRAAPAPVRAAEALTFLRNTALADALVSGLRFKTLQDRVRRDNAAGTFDDLLSLPLGPYAEKFPLLVACPPESRCPDLVALLGRHVLGVRVKHHGLRASTTMAEVRAEAAQARPLVDALARRSAQRGAQQEPHVRSFLLAIASTHVAPDVPRGTPVEVGGVQVLVLSEQDLTAFFGEQQLQLLAHARGGTPLAEYSR